MNLISAFKENMDFVLKHKLHRNQCGTSHSQVHEMDKFSEERNKNLTVLLGHKHLKMTDMNMNLDFNIDRKYGLVFKP